MLTMEVPAASLRRALNSRVVFDFEEDKKNAAGYSMVVSANETPIDLTNEQRIALKEFVEDRVKNGQGMPRAVGLDESGQWVAATIDPSVEESLREQITLAQLHLSK